MAKPPPAKDEMHYEAMAQDALRGVVKMALKRAASPQGLPGDHHFYITFKTKAPGSPCGEAARFSAILTTPRRASCAMAS